MRPRCGIAYQTSPRTAADGLQSASGAPLASPWVMNSGSPFAPVRTAMTRWVTTSLRPDSIWKVTALPIVMSSGSTGRSTMSVPGG